MRLNKYALICILLFASSLVHAQGIRYDNVLQGQEGVAIAGANVEVCSPSGNNATYPCSVPASIYSDESLTTPISQPFTTSSTGSYGFWAAPGHYVVQLWGAGLTNTNFDVFLASGGEAVPGDAIQYVSPNGNDSNDGLSWGTAKATITAAYTALPPCGYGSRTWSNCGTIYLAAGAWSVSSEISISSPFVQIRGRGEQATRILWTGTSGAAFYFTASPFNGGNLSNSAENNPGCNLCDLSIDGSGAGAGTYGIETYNIEGFHARGVGIQNFAGAGDACYYATASGTNVPNERYDVTIEMENCTVGWEAVSPSPYGGTFGYGWHNFWINPLSGQTAVVLNGANVSEDTMHIIINGSSGSTGFSLLNSASMTQDTGMIHMEGVSTGFSTASGTYIAFVGNIDEGFSAPTDSISGCLEALNWSTSSSIQFMKEGTACAVNSNLVVWGNPSSSLSGLSAGSCTLSSGTCSHTFTQPYPASPVPPPVCEIGPSATGNTYKYSASNTSITISSSSAADSSVVSFLCSLANN